MPFEFRDGLIWVKVMAQAAATASAGAGEVGGPLHFLLDSGAGSTVLSAEAARRLNAARGSATISAHRVNEKVAGYRAKDFHASLAGMPLCTTPLVLDLSRTSSFCSRAIDGLIGQDFLRGRVVQINFKTSMLRFLDSSSDTPVEGTMVMKLKTANAAFCVALSVNGSSAKWTRLDTGCDDGLHWVGSSSEAGANALASVQLGSERLTNVKTAWHRSPIFPDEAGLLGNGILSNYLVTIDAVKGRLLLKRS